jgi:hypothetical protein
MPSIQMGVGSMNTQHWLMITGPEKLKRDCLGRFSFFIANHLSEWRSPRL